MDPGIPSSTPSLTLRISLCASYVALLVGNTLPGLLFDDNAKISKRYETPLTPSGWAFSIWGLIFLLQGVGTVFAALPHGYGSDGSKARVVNAIGVWWQLGWLAEVAWQFTFVQQTAPGMWVCAGLLLAGFGCFAQALRRLYGLREDFAPSSSAFLWMCTLLPTSINTAWLSVASCLGALIVPRAYGVPADKLLVPSILLAAGVTLLGALVVYRKRDTAYGLTLVWALLAVYGRHRRAQPMRAAACACVLLLSVVSIASVLPRRSDAARANREELRPLRA